MADKIVDLLPRFAAPATPRYGAYDPEADLIDAYGVQPLMPSMVDPTMGGYSTRNPGFSIAAENPGVPVILPTTVPTNPNRYMKGVRYERDYGDFVPTFEARNPMAPNIPMDALSDESRSNPALIGAALGGGYSEAFGEGDTRYYDPSGSERAMLREDYAQYPGMAPPPPKMRLNDFPKVKSILKGESDFQVMPLGPQEMEYGPYQVFDPISGGM